MDDTGPDLIAVCVYVGSRPDSFDSMTFQADTNTEITPIHHHKPLPAPISSKGGARASTVGRRQKSASRKKKKTQVAPISSKKQRLLSSYFSSNSSTSGDSAVVWNSSDARL